MKLKANKKRNPAFNARKVWNTFWRKISWMDILGWETQVLKDKCLLMGLMLFIHVVRKEDSCVVKSYGLLKESEWIALAIFLNIFTSVLNSWLNSPQLCRHIAVVCIDLWCSAGVYFRSYFSCTVEKRWFIFLLQKWLTTNAFQEPGPVNQPQTCSWDSIKLIGHTVQL